MRWATMLSVPGAWLGGEAGGKEAGGSKLCGGVVLTLKTQGAGGGRRGERWEQTGHVGVGAGDNQVLREEGWLS